MMTQAHDAGYGALVLRDIPLDGPVARSFTRVLGWNDLAPRIVGAYDRAVLHTNADDDELLREALGAKKLKELRRQRNRLADVGTLRFSVAQTPPDVRDALEGFLKLEAAGWKVATTPRSPAMKAMRRSSVAAASRSPQPASARSSRSSPATFRWHPALCCASATARSSSRSPSTKRLGNFSPACSDARS